MPVQDFALAFADAMRLVIGLDPDLMEIISLSLEVSLAAVLRWRWCVSQDGSRSSSS
jgi:ABC-type tungstate transport system substrate-binding protein